ncbi:MAG: ABC transporter permease [Cyanobacteriota bacterium]|nr:ABC transporter permease [Cyanobacteriota bacterium]
MAKIIDRIGEWNPQFYREIKGKLKRRNIILTVLISLTVQFFCVLPSTSSSYRSGGGWNWNFNWLPIFHSLNWLLPFCLLMLGVYLIASDLSREQARGTLNFVRLSPQSSESILLGKLLGVPILLYFGIALALPLHLKAGFAAEIPWFRILGVYPLWGGLCGIFYGVALLIALLPKTQGENHNQRSTVGVSSLLALMTAPTLVSAIQYGFATSIGGLEANLMWFFLTLDGLFAYIWMLGTLCALNTWIWQATNRRFRNPNRALLSKLQSYQMVFSTQLWLLGFAVPVLANPEADGPGIFGIVSLFSIAPIEILMLASLLSPDRQTLLDWTSYRHRQKRQERALLKDLLLGEKSPAVAAIALNLALVALIWLPWLLLISISSVFDTPSAPPVTFLNLLLGLWMTAAIVLIYTTMNQLVRFYAKTPKQVFALAIPWGFAAFLPLIIAGIFTLSPEQFPLLWLFSPVPVAGIFYASTTTLLFGFLGQLGILGLLARRLHNSLKQAGISESKQLLLDAQKERHNPTRN